MIEKTKLKKKLPFETIDTFKNNENNKSGIKIIRPGGIGMFLLPIIQIQIKKMV